MATKKTTTKKSLPKAQNGKIVKPTADSTFYYGNKAYVSELKALTAQNKPEMDKQFNERNKATLDKLRQSKKGEPGYDKNGFPIKKSTAKKK